MKLTKERSQKIKDQHYQQNPVEELPLLCLKKFFMKPLSDLNKNILYI